MSIRCHPKSRGASPARHPKSQGASPAQGAPDLPGLAPPADLDPDTRAHEHFGARPKATVQKNEDSMPSASTPADDFIDAPYKAGVVDELFVRKDPGSHDMAILTLTDGPTILLGELGAVCMN